MALVALAALLALGRRLRRPLRRAVAPLLRRWRGIRRLGTYLRAVARRDHLLALDSLYGQLQPRATEPGLRATVAGNASAARSLERLLHAARHHAALAGRGLRRPCGALPQRGE